MTYLLNRFCKPEATVATPVPISSILAARVVVPITPIAPPQLSQMISTAKNAWADVKSVRDGKL